MTSQHRMDSASGGEQT